VLGALFASVLPVLSGVEGLARATPPLLGQALRQGSGQALRQSSGQALRQGSGQALRQSSGQSPASAPTAAQIAPFVGDWLVTVTVMANDATFAVSVKADGRPSATIRTDGQPTVNVSDITMAGNGL